MSTRPREDDRSPSPLSIAAQALTEATTALGEALKSATTDATDALEGDLAHGLRTAARAVESVTAKFGSREARRDRTRQDLITAATTVFAGQGYDGASVDDVAAAAGYTKGAVYSHFGSKADLFLAIYQARVDTARADPRTADTFAVPGDASLADALEQARTDPWLPLSYELLLFGLRHPESRDEVARIYSDLLSVTVDALAPTAQHPTTTARRDALDAVLVGTAVAHTLTMLNTLGVHGVDDDAVLRLVRMHWPLLTPDPPRDGTHGSPDTP